MNNSAFSLYLYTGITVVYKVKFEFAQFERAIVETGQFIRAGFIWNHNVEVAARKWQYEVCN